MSFFTTPYRQEGEDDDDAMEGVKEGDDDVKGEED